MPTSCRCGIAGAELTPFSHLDRGQIRRRLFPKITITITEPRRLAVPAELRGRARRRAASLQLYDIMSDLVFRTQELGNTLFEAILKARRIHGHHYPILEDSRAASG